MNSIHPITKLNDKQFSRAGEAVLPSRRKGADFRVRAPLLEVAWGFGVRWVFVQILTLSFVRCAT